MRFIQQVYEKRKKLAAVLCDEEYLGIRKLVEELYPDKAHFIYELLQNAEDANATEANFELYRDRLLFRHNGRPFSEDDVKGITNIGKGSKQDKDDEIGRFGVGFKSVFAYSETPLVLSPTYSFRIIDLVLPEEVKAPPGLNGQTHFEFPFNNTQKDPVSAYDEIRIGLNELAETTLLFLTNLQSISWKIGTYDTGEVLKVPHSDHHVAVLKQVNDKTTETYHYLKFTEPVTGLEKQNVAVAFELDFLPDITEYISSEPIANQLRISIASPGRVAVFFPAEKETSGLRFHLHAPFVPELSRASVKETPSNEPLFDQLAVLTAASLHSIRDLGLMTREFLAVLPNRNDGIATRYECVREAIVNEMNSEPLTPTHDGKGHAPALQMLQARAELKNLLSDSDLALFHGNEKHWVVSPTQRNNNVDRFLHQLKIDNWDIVEWLKYIEDVLFYDDLEICCFDKEGFFTWISQKSMDWHQQLYATLYRGLEQLNKMSLAEEKPIIRLANGQYEKGKCCFFPDDIGTASDVMLRVDWRVYNSGKNKSQQKTAKEFLKSVGVRKVGEYEQVELILKQRYTNKAQKPDEKTYYADLKRFVALVEDSPSSADLFENYYVLQSKDDWTTPDDVFLDLPIFETGLMSYYQALGDDAERKLLSDVYINCGINRKKLVKFLIQIGVHEKLDIENIPCKENPKWDYLKSVRGVQFTSPIDRDFIIKRLNVVLQTQDFELSKLIWCTMAALQGSEHYLKARYRKNYSSGHHEADSQLVHILRKERWVPQVDDLFVRPPKASRDLLPDGFPFDPGWQWLKAIKFGEKFSKRSKKDRQLGAVARKLGFENEDILKRAKKFAHLPTEEQERILKDFDERQGFELPENVSPNPKRRAKKVRAEAVNAPIRKTEVRPRSISVDLEDIKERAKEYLIQQYTNPDYQMICQACKKPLPFKLDDGSEYFERVEFLRELNMLHYQNYLALCPNHAAMFKHANGSRDELKNNVNETASNEITVILAQQETTIYFTKTHLADLKEIFKIDAKQSKSESDDDGTGDVE